MKRRSVLGALAVLAVVAPAFAQSPAAKPAEPPRITVAELKSLLAKKAVVVIDVRQVVAYEQGHIPGSLSVPDVDKQIAALKGHNKPVVAYCS